MGLRKMKRSSALPPAFVSSIEVVARCLGHLPQCALKKALGDNLGGRSCYAQTMQWCKRKVFIEACAVAVHFCLGAVLTGSQKTTRFYFV